MLLLAQLLQLVVVVLITLAGWFLTAAVADSWLLTLFLGLVTAGAALAGYLLVVRRTEHRPVTELAGKNAGRGLGAGFLIGVSMIAATVAVIALLGGYHVHGFGSLTAPLAVVGIMVAATVTEELIVRGLLLRAIEQRVGTWAALLITAPLFGAMHLFNTEATLWGAVAITLEAGGLLAAAYLATRSLWFPIGLHAGWNIAQVAVFGTVSSGSNTPGTPRGHHLRSRPPLRWRVRA